MYSATSFFAGVIACHQRFCHNPYILAGINGKRNSSTNITRTYTNGWQYIQDSKQWEKALK